MKACTIGKLAAVAVALSLPAGLTGCATSHTETTKDNLLGGQTHQSTTVYRNPDGSTTVDKETQVTH